MGLDKITEVSAEIVRWGTFFTAVFLALGVAAGWLETELGIGLGIPSLSVAPRLRLPILALCFLVAAFAVPISNAVVEALF